MVFINLSLGLYASDFFPESEGADYEVTPYLKHFNHLRNQFSVISGLSHPDVGGLHASEMSFLTAAPHPGTPGFRNTVSVDQLAATHVMGQTRFPFLSMGTNNGSLSWTTNGVRISPETDPQRLFRRMFLNGTPSEIRQEEQRLQEGHSILDSVRSQTRKMMQHADSDDRDRLEQYFNALRDVERQMQLAESWSQKPKPAVNSELPGKLPGAEDIIGRADLLLQMAFLALRTDSTRIVTLSLDPDGGVPPIDGVKETRHNLSHHGQDPGKLEQLRSVENAELKAICRFVDQLHQCSDTDGTLLDHTSVFLGSNLGNASNHDTHNLPAMLFGGGFKHGQYWKLDKDKNTPLSNLYLSMLRRFGLEINRFGSSTETLDFLG